MATRRAKIQEEYRDSDGYWIHLAYGWKNGSDPVGHLHSIVEDTKREAYSVLTCARPCDCEECATELAKKVGVK